MGLVIQKYGGSSVANADKIRHVASRVIECKEKGNAVVVVVSAMGDTTDDLIALARALSEEPSDREMDVLMSTGEQISMSLLAMCLEAKGYPSISFTGAQAGIHTSGVHRKARILSVEPTRVSGELEKGKIVVVAGFQGIDHTGDITTLGRGGSDTTAVALAAALNADVCEIYTDVDGVYTANPRVVKDARKLDVISYDENRNANLVLSNNIAGAWLVNLAEERITEANNTENTVSFDVGPKQIVTLELELV
jgi:aspartate kinase